MNSRQTKQKDPLKIRNYSFFGAVVWTILLAFVLNVNVRTIKNEALKRAYTYTQVGFDKDVLYRRWAAEHGGVYVRIDSTTQPNPYLLHIPDRDIIVDSNLKLTLLNPAYMTRQVYELQEASSDVRGHITSLKLMRSENAPDDWEIKALNAFENGASEYSGLDILNGEEYFRFMKPFATEESCLKCHAKQGYKLNDIRGGVSIAYPMARLASLNKTEIRDQYILYFVLWVMGIGGIIFSYFKLTKNDQKRILAEESLNKFNRELEEKVEIKSKELLKSRQDWENIFNTLETPAQLIDKNHTIKYVNDATLKIFESTREELIGKKCHVLFHLSDTPPDGCPLVSALNENKAFSNEILFDANGTTYIVSCSPIYDTEGNIEHFMHIMTDISERKITELKLKESEKKLDLIFEAIPFAVNLIDQKGIILDCNKSLVKLHGYENKEELIGKHNSILFPEYEIERTKEDIATIMKLGKSLGLKYDLKQKNGTIFPAEISSSLFFDAVKNEMYLVSAAEDISNKLEAEIQFKTLLEHAGDAFYLSDFEGDILEVNKEAIKEMGYSRQEFQKMKVWELDAVWTDPKALKTFWETMKFNEPITFESVHRRKDGSDFSIELRATLIEVKGKKAIMGFARNITERKKIDEELAKHRQNLEVLVKERTREFEEKSKALERINKLFVGRELRMAELKEEIEKLKGTSTGSV